MDGTSLDKQVNQLKVELDQKNNDLVLAAEIGKKLLEQNQDLEDRLEQLAYDHTKRLEQLEQDKYSLQLKLSAKDKLEQSQAVEIESLRESLQNERDSARCTERMEMTHSKEIQKMTEKTEELQIAQERAAMIEEQLRKKVEQQNELLKDAHNKLSSLEVAPDKNDEQLYSLQHDLAKSKSEKDVIALALEDSKHKCQQLMFTIDVQKQRIQTLGNEVEEKEQQATGYYNMLEKTQEEVVELRLELDAAKMEETDINKRGNSLFAEVEDRRKEIENKMISLKVQNESIKEQFNMKKQQVHKMRIAALLQMGGGRADSSQRERLEQSLEQSRSEVHMLTEKIKTLEKAKTNEGMEHQLQEYKKLLSESDKPDLVEFLQHKLRTAKSDIENLRKELETQQLLQISASDKLMDCERRLYNAETETDRTRAVNVKLMVTIDDLKVKINGREAGSSKTKISTGYREKICLKKSDNKENVSDGSPPKGQHGVNRSLSPSREVPSDEMISPEQKPPVIDDVTLSSTNQKQDTVNLRQEGYILKPANQSQALIPSRPGKKQSKKSVSMCETVSVLDATGNVDATSESLKSGDDDPSRNKRSRRLEQDVDSVLEENEDPEMRQMVGGSRGSRHGGKKHHKVVHMKSNNAAECKQQ